MANIPLPPSKYQYNLLHALSPYVNAEKALIHAIIENNKGSLGKYELITESGQLKLDRMGFSSLVYPFAYGAIPQTWDEDNDPLDVEIIGATEELIPGCLVEARIIGIMKFNDGGEVDDKVVAVLADDKRMEHIKTIADLGEYFIKETTYFWEHYKDLKKPGTTHVDGFFDTAEAVKIIDTCAARYQTDYASKVVG